MLRVHVDLALSLGLRLELPPEAARHVQVMRLQPGDTLVLFNGQGGEWSASVLEMGRRHVSVELLGHTEVERELPGHICLALGMPANERFDWLVEKACELGAHEIQPLICERSVLRVAGDRAERKRDHWQAVAIAAAEQCGRTHPLLVQTPLSLTQWLTQSANTPADTNRWLLSLQPDSRSPGEAAGQSLPHRLTLLSGPEGGLSAAEEGLALAHGYRPISLGQRVMRAETAPLACLAWLGLQRLG